MKSNARLIMGLAMVLLLLINTACANGGDDSSDSEIQQTGNTETESTDKLRVVTSVKGDIRIPEQPSKVIGLSVVYPEFLYALGVTPIAVQNYHADYPAYLNDAFKDILKMGIAEVPNFEAILSAEPDLIIAPVWWSEKDYDQLSKIAPTVLLPQRDNWRDELLDIADVLGKREAAEKVISDLQSKEDEAKKRLDELVGDESVLYMMIMAKEIVIYGEKIDRGIFIHKTLGLNPIKEFPQTESSLSISLEKIPEYNPDHLIIQLDDESNQEVQNRYQEMLESPLWKNMTAVKNNQVYMMGGKEWFSLGMSPLADVNAIDDVLSAFEKKGN